jgi:hypothetical protein
MLLTEARRRHAARVLIPGRGHHTRRRARTAVAVTAGAFAFAGVTWVAAANTHAADNARLTYHTSASGHPQPPQTAMAATADGTAIATGQGHLAAAADRLQEALGGTPDPAVLGAVDDETRAGVQILTRVAVARHDTAMLDEVDVWGVGQRATLAAAAVTATGQVSTRIGVSLRLLADVQARTSALRAGLRCLDPARVRVDELGPRPLPQPCPSPSAGAGVSAGAGHAAASAGAGVSTMPTASPSPRPTPSAGRSAGSGGGPLGWVGRLFGG